jgi:hypothetical protein
MLASRIAVTLRDASIASHKKIKIGGRFSGALWFAVYLASGLMKSSPCKHSCNKISQGSVFYGPI